MIPYRKKKVCPPSHSKSPNHLLQLFSQLFSALSFPHNSTEQTGAQLQATAQMLLDNASPLLEWGLSFKRDAFHR